MSMFKNSVALLALIPLLGSCLIKPLGINVYAGYMNIEPSGEFALNDSTGSQSLGDIQIDVVDEFNIEDAGTIYLRADMDIGSWDLTLSGYSYDETGASILSEKFGDLPAGSTVTTDLSILNVKGAITYPLPATGLVGLDIGVGVCIDYFNVDLDVNSSAPVVGFESIDFNAPVPMLYGKARFDFPGIPFGASLDIGWLDVSLSDMKGNFLDTEAMILFTPLPTIEIFLGYRYTVIDAHGDIDGQDFDTDLQLEGWYFGGGFSF